jgi:hypothetical protein
MHVFLYELGDIGLSAQAKLQRYITLRTLDIMKLSASEINRLWRHLG